MTDKQSNTTLISPLTSGSLNHNSLNVSQIGRYAAAAGAGLAMAGAADASIIYSGVQNITVQIDPAFQATSSNITSTGNFSSIGIDIDNDGTDDIGAVALNFGSLAGTASVKYLGGAFLSASNSASFLNNVVSSNADILASSSNVGASGNFSAGGAGQFRQNVISTGTNAGSSSTGASFVPNTAFVGIQLGSGNFGWIRLLIEDLGPNQPFSTILGGTPLGDGLNFADKITVIDWAFEDTGNAIHVGAVPEPSSLALLAAGAAGISAFRRRKSHKKA